MVLADTGYDAQGRVLAPLRDAGKTAVIPPARARTEQRGYDRDLHRARRPIEHCSCRLTHYRARSTRHDKTRRPFLAAVHLAASAILPN